MLSVSRRLTITRTDGRIVIYSALFMLCALLSAVGGGAWGALAFMPTAVAMDIASRNCVGSSNDETTHPPS